MARKLKSKTMKKIRKVKVAAPAPRGGARKGAGRKSIEVHFASINAKLDMLMKNAGIVAVEPVFTQPVAAAKAPPAVEAKPEKVKPGRKAKKLALAPVEAIEKVPTVKLAEVPAETAPLAPPQAYVAPVVVQAPVAPPSIAQQAAQFAQQQVVQAPAQPVVFAPPPAPVLTPQFVGVAPTLPAQPQPDFDAAFNALPPQRPPQ